MYFILGDYCSYRYVIRYIDRENFTFDKNVYCTVGRGCN